MAKMRNTGWAQRVWSSSVDVLMGDVSGTQAALCSLVIRDSLCSASGGRQCRGEVARDGRWGGNGDGIELWLI
jgi:hypothetical protein